MAKAVIFDIDNTLIEFVDRKKAVIRESVKGMIDGGLKEDFQKLHDDFYKFYWKNGIENQQIFEKYLKSRYGKIDYRVLAHAILAYRKANTGLLRPYPGAKDVLIRLKGMGCKLAILSDAPKLEAHLRLCAVGFDDFFDVILTASDVGALKPSSKGFKMAAKLLGVELSDCIMVGDKLAFDVAGAKKLGMASIFAKYGIVTGHEDTRRNIPKDLPEPDYSADDIRDIPMIVGKLMN